MFVITVIFASLLFVPVTCFARKSPVVNFYWCGFWSFLAVIAAIAGGNSTLMIVGHADPAIAERLFPALVTLYVGFVVVGWFHLSGKAALMIFSRIRG
jgi:hypothetical protein